MASNARWETAIEALLTTSTHKAAAEKAGIAERTLRGYLAAPAFLAMYRDARRRIVETAVGQLQQLCGQAVQALERNMACGRAAVEVRAALGVLEQATAAIELGDVLSRIEALEAAAKPRLAR